MLYPDLEDYPFQHGPDGWPLAQRLFTDAQYLFGTPAIIMFGRMREGAKRWIYDLDKKLNIIVALVRRLILIEACAIKLTPGVKRGPMPPRNQKLPIRIYKIQQEPVVAFFTDRPRMKDDSAAWRVSLRLFPTLRAKPKRAYATTPSFKPSNSPRARMLLMRRLANRLEAISRVLANPELYARRVARLLLTRKPRWLATKFPGPGVTRKSAHIIRPAHIIALRTLMWRDPLP